MVLLLRFLVTMLKSFFRPRIGPLDESVLTFRALPNDLDLNLHVNAGRYISFIDIGRVELLGRFGIFRQVMRRGWRPLVGGSIIHYRRSVLPFETFKVRSRVLCWDEKWFYFQHIVERRGEPAVTAYVRGLLRGKEGNVPPAELLALAGQRELPSPPIPELLRRWIELEALR